MKMNNKSKFILPTNKFTRLLSYIYILYQHTTNIVTPNIIRIPSNPVKEKNTVPYKLSVIVNFAVLNSIY